MWVVLNPSLVGDGAVPAVREGEQIEAALVLEADGSPGEYDAAVDGGDGAITHVPAARPQSVSPRYRVTGTGTVHGKRVGVEVGGLFVLCDDPAPEPGRVFEATGDLHLSTWLVSRAARCIWVVRAIVLHTAPVPLREQPAVADGSPVPASGARLVTAGQYIDAVGAQQAGERGVWVRGGAADYTAGEQRRVEQAVTLGRDPVGGARRYLLDVDPAPHP